MAETILDTDDFPAEQFREARQQAEAATLGMWTFLASEVLFFGAIFAAFFVYRTRWPNEFAHAAREMHWVLGTVNTAVLLCSSFAMAMAVHSAREGNNKRIARWLLATIGLAVLFLGVKATEYALEYREHLVPGLNFSTTAPDGTPRPDQARLFMTFYFVSTALHATHMLAGIAIIALMFRRARKNVFTAEYHNPIDGVGLYWHFVDLVWVFLFPTLYLLRHP